MLLIFLICFFKSDFLGEVEIEIDDLIEGYEKVITVPLNRVRTGEITIGLKAVNWSGSKCMYTMIHVKLTLLITK